jgi:hypothetical protein
MIAEELYTSYETVTVLCFTYIAHLVYANYDLSYGQYLFRPNHCMNNHKVMIPNSQPFIFINETVLNSSVFLPSDWLQQHYLIFSESWNHISVPKCCLSMSLVSNTGWQPHVSRFTLCSPKLDSLCNFMFLCCASTPDLSQLLTCSVAVLCGTNVGHYTVFCLRSSCIQSFCNELDFLSTAKTPIPVLLHFRHMKFSSKMFFHLRSPFSNKYFHFIVFERFYNHYSLSNGPALP